MRSATDNLRVLVVEASSIFEELPINAFVVAVSRAKPTDVSDGQWLTVIEYGEVQFGTFYLGFHGLHGPLKPLPA